MSRVTAAWITAFFIHSIKSALLERGLLLVLALTPNGMIQAPGTSARPAINRGVGR